MNRALIPSAWRKRLLALAGAAVLLVAPGHNLFAEPNDAEAQAAAKAWIDQIDKGLYLESYDTGCTEFHHRVSQDKWVLVLKAFRPSFGPVVSRKEISHDFKADGVNGLDGQCMIFTYDTSFQRLKGGFEKVVLKLEDGKWRGAAYVAGPKPESPPPANVPPPPEVNTEVQSTQTQHPQQ